MNIEVKLGKKEGRAVLLVIIIMIITIFFGIFLYAANVDLLWLIIVVFLINFFCFRYLVFLYRNKPVIYIKDNQLVISNPVFFRRKFPLSEIICFQSRIVSRRFGCLTVKHYKGKTICETILGGDIYEKDLEKLPLYLNKLISQFNLEARNEYSKNGDKTSAYSLFSLSTRTILILAVIQIPISLLMNIYVFQTSLSSSYYIYLVIFYLLYSIVAFLYFKKVIKNYIFQYISYFFVVYPFVFGFIYYLFKIPNMMFN